MSERLGMRLARIAAADERVQRPAQQIVFNTKCIVAAIPYADRFLGDVVEHPTLARFHARLANAGAQNVIVVAHDDAAQRVDYLALIALDIEYMERAIEPLFTMLVPAIVGHSQKSPAE